MKAQREENRFGSARSQAHPDTGASVETHPAEPLLAVVVIARNEERHIGRCLHAVLAAVKPFTGAQVVVVDSDSPDRTVATAARFPVSVYRYRSPRLTAAAGRRIGFQHVRARYVLFVDGDCMIEPQWVRRAVAELDAAPDAAVVYGGRREVYEGVAEGFTSVGPAPHEYGLGGNALYRSEALVRAGGFNPYLIAEEEAELLGRLVALGYRAIRTPEVMITHYTAPKDSAGELLRRMRRGYWGGQGPVLRLALRHGLFAYHARRYNRYLIAFGYLALGAALLLAVTVTGAGPLLAWLALGLGVLAALGLRRRSFRSALYILAEWGLGGVGMARQFLRKPESPDRFSPAVERIK